MIELRTTKGVLVVDDDGVSDSLDTVRWADVEGCTIVPAEQQDDTLLTLATIEQSGWGAERYSWQLTGISIHQTADILAPYLVDVAARTGNMRGYATILRRLNGTAPPSQ